MDVDINPGFESVRSLLNPSNSKAYSKYTQYSLHMNQKLRRKLIYISSFSDPATHRRTDGQIYNVYNLKL